MSKTWSDERRDCVSYLLALSSQTEDVVISEVLRTSARYLAKGEHEGFRRLDFGALSPSGGADDGAASLILALIAGEVLDAGGSREEVEPLNSSGSVLGLGKCRRRER